MLWLIYSQPMIGQEKERILGAINAPDIAAAQKKVERLLPGRKLSLREADDRWPLTSRSELGADRKTDV